MNREELIEYIQENSFTHSKADLTKHTEKELLLLALSIDFEKKRKSLMQKEKKIIECINAVFKITANTFLPASTLFFQIKSHILGIISENI